MNGLRDDRQLPADLSGPPERGLMTERHWELAEEFGSLTPRETAVCRLLLQAITRAEIAKSLGISPRTVRQHLEQIHRKLNVTNRVGVVLRIIQTRGWLAVGICERHAKTSDGELSQRN